LTGYPLFINIQAILKRFLFLSFLGAEGMKIKSPKDFWAGLMFIAFGLFFVIGARNYRMGSAARMGPAYFPTMLGGLMAVIGGLVFFRSLAVKGGKVPAIPLRLLFIITLSMLLFGYLLKPIGLVLALALLVLVSAFAGQEFKIKEVLILSAVLILLSVLVFVKGLGLPFPLWPGFLV
jgi:hypothetical protein